MLTLYTSGYRYSKKRCINAVNWFIAKYLPRHKLEINVNHRGLAREGVYVKVATLNCIKDYVTHYLVPMTLAVVSPDAL